MLPDCTDEDLLDELAVVVSTGWGLPARPNRAAGVRHLLLLTNPADSLSDAQAAQRLLTLLDDALRDAGDDVLGEDDRTGCRILLGVHPSYRNEPSPTVRRREAAEFLVPAWHDYPPRDPAGSFQRRHQEGALRQVLACLRGAYGQDNDQLIRDYDIVRADRWCLVAPSRQIVRYGESTDYRIRRDDLTRLVFTESDLAESVASSQLRVLKPDGEPAPTLLGIRVLETQPGRREIAFRLPRAYQAGERLSLRWEEELAYEPAVPGWGRDWLAVSAPNDHFELEVTATFAEEAAAIPDLCWWYSAQPEIDITEIGPHSLAHLIDLSQSHVATHSWAAAETERRMDYGLIWVWFDDGARERWEEARARLLIAP